MDYRRDKTWWEKGKREDTKYKPNLLNN